MTDTLDALVERLRGFTPKNSITREAADAIEALRKDAERLDWWQEQGSNAKISPPSLGFEWSGVVPGRSVYGKTLRDLFDAAMKGEKP